MAQTTQSSALLIDLHNTINQSSDSSSQKQKLIAIEKQLSKWASENMTLQRKLFESERQSSRFEQLCSDLEKHAGKIQKVCLASDDEYQKEINRLEGRLMELEDQLLAINEDHDRALRASTASIEQLTGSVDAPTAESKTKFAAKLNYQSSSSEDFPNPAWSIGRQLEFCIQRIADKNTLVSGLTKEINQMQMKLVDSEGSLQMTRTKLDDKNAEVLRLEQTAKSLADMQPQMESKLL
jgi:chromosome segregation ATPase